MSTFAYGRITARRQESAAGMTEAAEPPGYSTWVDTLAALVPGEVLAAHATIIAFTTKTEEGTNGDEVVTTITSPGTLKVAFLALLVLAALLYVFGHKGAWRGTDYVRLLLAPVAFFGWTLLQKPSALDAFSVIDKTPRLVFAVLLAVLVGGLAKYLAQRADQEQG